MRFRSPTQTFPCDASPDGPGRPPSSFGRGTRVAVAVRAVACLAAAGALVLGCAAASADVPQFDTPEAVIADARAHCAAFENGVFDEGDAITRITLGDPPAPVVLVDEGAFACSSAASLWCGTGGCGLHLLAGDRVLWRLAKGWRVTEWAGDRLLLIALHGADCGGTGVQRCYEAIALGPAGFLTLRPPWPE